jgi:hypothetical protein
MATPATPPTPAGPQPSPIQTIKPAVSFQTDNVPPTQYLFVRDEDQLIIEAISNFANEPFTIKYRYLTPQNEIKETTKTLSLAAAGAQAFFAIALAEGWILSIALQGQTLGANIWLWAQLSIARQGFTAGFFPYGVFWEGFVPALYATGWPGVPSKEPSDGAGTLISIIGSTPGAGSDISETVPNDRRRELLAFTASLATSATAVTRDVFFTLDDGANVFFQGPSYVGQAPSTNQSYSVNASLTVPNGRPGPVSLLGPIGISLKTGYRIRTITNNLQAGDQWTAPHYLVLEWPQIDG